MKTTLSLFVLAALLNVGLVGGTYASDDMVAAGSQTLKGDVLKIEGEYYVLKDPHGDGSASPCRQDLSARG